MSNVLRRRSDLYCSIPAMSLSSASVLQYAWGFFDQPGPNLLNKQYGKVNVHIIVCCCAEAEMEHSLGRWQSWYSFISVHTRQAYRSQAGRTMDLHAKLS